MAQFIMIFKLVISLLPLIIEAIKLVEEAIPGKGNGEAKLDVVRATLESTYSSVTASDPLPKFEQLWNSISGIVKSLVAAFNKSGVFTK